MELILRFVVLSLVLLISSCQTTALWRGQADDEFIKVIPTSADEDVEAALKASHREYHCQQLYASTYPNNKVCYARLTHEDRVKNIKLKLLKTPETLAVDTGRTIKVVGSVALNIIMSVGLHKG